MEKWQRFSKENSNLGLTDSLSMIIVAEIGELSDEFFSYEGPKLRPRQTRLIKDKLSLLGKRPMPGKPEYQVYANGISEDLRQENKGHFRNAEWLYDMHWYLDGDEPYTTTVVPLVMECEWNPVHRKDRNKVPFSGIKYDFQKLLLANASLRLMIFKVKKLSHLEELQKYFIQNIKNYQHLPPGALFLFIAFTMDQHTFFYWEHSKK